MVKLLVATTKGQGQRSDDYAWAVDGELVYVPDNDCSNPKCGCERGFAGLASSKSTTTALVVDRPDISEGLLFELLDDAMERQGWIGSPRDPSDDEFMEYMFLRVVIAANAYPTGTVLQRKGDKLLRRTEVEPLTVPDDTGSGDVS